MKLDDDLLRELTEMFVAEAREYLDGISRALLNLEKLQPAEQAPVLAEIFRQAHSLKGSARAVGVPGVERLANELESTFSILKTERRAPSPELVDRIFKALDTIASVVAVTAGEQTESGVDIDLAVRRLKGEEIEEAHPAGPPGPASPHPEAVAAVVPAPAVLTAPSPLFGPPIDPVIPALSTLAPSGVLLPRTEGAEEAAPALPMQVRPVMSSLGSAPAPSTERTAPTPPSAPRGEPLSAPPAAPLSAPRGPTPAAAHRPDPRVGESSWAVGSPEQKSTAAPKPLPVPPPVSRGDGGGKGPEETVRVSVSKLDALMASVGELHITLQSAERHMDTIREDLLALERWRSEFRKLRGQVKNARRFLSQSALEAHVVDEQQRGAVPREVLAAVSVFMQDTWDRFSRLELQLSALRRDQRRVGAAARTLLEDVHHVRMQPFSTLLDTYPRAVRDLCRELGKEVELQSSGGEVELDRALLEQLRAPMLHILRNCLDHGIEAPAQRQRLGKTPQGVLQIRVAQVGDRVRITVADNGAGIDLERVRSVAVEKGILSEEAAQALPDQSVVQLIFHSGLSTRQSVSNVSGRGVGMDVVREVIERLHGEIQVQTRMGEGTTFQLSVPLTVGSSLCLLVEAERHRLALPVAQVVRLLRVPRSGVKKLEGAPAVTFGARLIPVVRLAEALGLSGQGGEINLDAPVLVVVLGHEERAVGFQVDLLLGARELVLKQLPRPFVRVRNVSGASILGDGSVLPVLNAGDLLRSAARLRSGARGSLQREASKAETPHHSSKTRILVVDDSVSTRTLEKNILEAAGYEVITGTDGLHAWQLLQQEKVSLVISDVNMPRMEGVELVERIRADKRLQHLPFILVTSLDSKEDREKGLQAGADAYFTKGDFDQGNLLAAVRRLI